jgi:hypothetical protein
MADFLFVQNARGIAYADGKLTLEGVNLAITHISADRLRRPGLDTAPRSW